MAAIHKFIKLGIPIVLDINSGAVHAVDRLVYDILDYYPQMGREEIIERLSGKYPAQEIGEGIEEIKELEERGLLFSEDRYHDIARKGFETGIVKALCLHVAHDCNMLCEYCFASQGNFKGDRSLMSKDIAFKAVDFLIQKSGNRKNIEIDFFGGEPLLNFGVVKATVDYGRERAMKAGKNIRFTITTNGLLLDDEVIDYINQNMYNVVLSLDGRPEINDRMRCCTGGKGTYNRVVERIKRLVEKRGNKLYYVRGTFTRCNLDFSKDVIHMADLGFKNISVEPVVAERERYYSLREEDLDIILQQYDRLLDEYVKRMDAPDWFEFFHFKVNLQQGPCVVKRLSGCGAGYQYLAVTPEGDLYPCHQFVGDKDFYMGNVADGKLREDISASFKNAHVYNKEECRDCWARFYCSGGCHANSYKFYGNISSSYKIGCEMEKKRLECAIALEVLRWLKEEKGNEEIQG